MTRDDILAASGRELDGLVAQAQGIIVYTAPPPRQGEAYTVYTGDRDWLEPGDLYFVDAVSMAWRAPDYHSDWQHAGPLLKEMAEAGAEPVLQHDPEMAPGPQWRAGATISDDRDEYALGTTPQEAIARVYCLWRLERGEQS